MFEPLSYALFFPAFFPANKLAVYFQSVPAGLMNAL